MSGAVRASQTGMNQGKARACERDKQNAKDAKRHRRFGQCGRGQKGSPPFLRMSGMGTGDEREAQYLHPKSCGNEYDSGQRRRKERQCR